MRMGPLHEGAGPFLLQVSDCIKIPDHHRRRPVRDEILEKKCADSLESLRIVADRFFATIALQLTDEDLEEVFDA